MEGDKKKYRKFSNIIYCSKDFEQIVIERIQKGYYNELRKFPSIFCCDFKQLLEIHVIMRLINTQKVDWTTQIHKYYPYPKEFNNIIFICLCVFNRLNKTINTQISKDIRLMFIKHIANVWEMIGK